MGARAEPLLGVILKKVRARTEYQGQQLSHRSKDKLVVGTAISHEFFVNASSFVTVMCAAFIGSAGATVLRTQSRSGACPPS